MFDDVNQTLFVITRRLKRILSVYRLDFQPCLLKRFLDLSLIIGPLGKMVFHSQIIFPVLRHKDIQIHLDDIVFPVAVLPGAVNVSVVVDKGVVGQYFPMFVAGVYIEDKNSVGMQKQRNLLQSSTKIVVVGQMV